MMDRAAAQEHQPLFKTKKAPDLQVCGVVA
jgi:hypothetical protein